MSTAKISDESISDLGKCFFWIMLGLAAIILSMGGCGYMWGKSGFDKDTSQPTHETSK
jgi:hypothetical protein